MRAEVISIGDELITGQRLDTNSQWLSERLTELGVEVAVHTTIGDRLEDNVAAFRLAIERADVVVVTGGLGPTADDLTREALAAAAGVELVRDEASLEHIRQLFASRGREMPERNVVQADFPVRARPIRNEQGTAPGIEMRIRLPRPPDEGRGEGASSSGAPPHPALSQGERVSNDTLVFCLPGVPAEMKPMWFASVAPAIAAASPTKQVIRHRRIRCFGVGESQLEAMLPDLIRRGRDPVVGITVSDAVITLRITATAADDATCWAAIAPTEDIIRSSLGTLVYGVEEEELEDVVVRLLAERKKTVAIAEWATAGRLTASLVAATQAGGKSGVVADDVVAAGVVLTQIGQLHSFLGVEASEEVAHAHDHDSVVATAIAEGVRRMTGADFGLGIAAFPAEVDTAAARVCVSIATDERTRRLRFGCASHPALRQPRTVKQALNALRLVLMGVGLGGA